LVNQGRVEIDDDPYVGCFLGINAVRRYQSLLLVQEAKPARLQRFYEDRSFGIIPAEHRAFWRAPYFLSCFYIFTKS
jgi:hypothetical protein